MVEFEDDLHINTLVDVVSVEVRRLEIEAHRSHGLRVENRCRRVREHLEERNPVGIVRLRCESPVLALAQLLAGRAQGAQDRRLCLRAGPCLLKGLRSEVNNSLIIVNFFHKIQNFRQISDLFSQI